MKRIFLRLTALLFVFTLLMPLLASCGKLLPPMTAGDLLNRSYAKMLDVGTFRVNIYSVYREGDNRTELSETYFVREKSVNYSGAVNVYATDECTVTETQHYGYVNGIYYLDGGEQKLSTHVPENEVIPLTVSEFLFYFSEDAVNAALVNPGKRIYTVIVSLTPDEAEAALGIPVGMADQVTVTFAISRIYSVKSITVDVSYTDGSSQSLRTSFERLYHAETELPENIGEYENID